jgi:hypothetical protein
LYETIKLNHMDRREAVQYIALLLGGTIVGSNAFITGCKTKDAKRQFTQEDIAYLDEIAETILPETKTPGAKAAKVGAFMPIMVNDCYIEKEQDIFHKGMETINERSEEKYDKNFMELTPQQRHELLVSIDTEAKDYQKKKKPEDPPHYFRIMKELTLLGYFTSEIGCKQAKRYDPVPGKYEGCVPYKQGDRAWTT